MGDSDQALIERCIAGDQPAWDALVRRYAGFVYSIPRRAGLPAEVCDDVAQVVFASFARQASKVRGGDRLASWFGAVARRETWRAVRRFRRQAGREVELAVDHEAPSGGTDDDAAQIELRAAIGQLGPPCRELIQMLFLETPNVTYAQAAERLGVASGSIGPTRQRCLGKLMVILERAGIDLR